MRYGTVRGPVARRTLHVLHGLRLRISFVVVDLTHPVSDVTSDRVARALEPLGVLEQLPGGAIGLLCFGPRPSGLLGDRTVEKDVFRRIADALGVGRTDAFGIRATHLWADELPYNQPGPKWTSTVATSSP
ncbi:MAG: hypothetical protein WD270_00270 [Acetobacterales bacterium]